MKIGERYIWNWEPQQEIIEIIKIGLVGFDAKTIKVIAGGLYSLNKVVHYINASLYIKILPNQDKI